ncbi:astacin, partial [Ostertagia ostertagi]
MISMLLVTLLVVFACGEPLHGHSIAEIEAKHHIHHQLHKRDFVLTTEAEQTAESTQDQAEVSGSRKKRQAARLSRSRLWLEGLNYFFDESPTALRMRSEEGVELWESNTCIDFKENSSATDRVKVFMGSGCWSYVGKYGGQQPLSLGEGCGTT